MVLPCCSEDVMSTVFTRGTEISILLHPVVLLIGY